MRCFGVAQHQKGVADAMIEAGERMVLSDAAGRWHIRDRRRKASSRYTKA